MMSTNNIESHYQLEVNDMLYKRKIICLDFDGVIHKNLKPWKNRETISYGVVTGTKEAIALLRKGYKVVVHSGRCETEQGRVAIERWLKAKGIEVDEVCRYKPMADYYVDDKAVQFKGDWSQLQEDIKGFKHWQALAKKIIRKNRLHPK